MWRDQLTYSKEIVANDYIYKSCYVVYKDILWANGQSYITNDWLISGF